MWPEQSGSLGSIITNHQQGVWYIDSFLFQTCLYTEHQRASDTHPHVNINNNDKWSEEYELLVQIWGRSRETQSVREHTHTRKVTVCVCVCDVSRLVWFSWTRCRNRSIFGSDDVWTWRSAAALRAPAADRNRDDLIRFKTKMRN